MFNNSYQTKPRKVARHSSPARKAGAMLAFAILAAVFAGSCSKGYSRFMKLPADPTIASELGWAIVTSAYAQSKTAPGKASPDGELIRRGTVFACTERRIDPEGEDLGGLWYRMAGGAGAAWLHESDLSIFTSEEQARQAADALP